MRKPIVLTLTLLALAACQTPVPEIERTDFKPAEGTPLPPGPKTMESTDEVVGTGAEAKKGDAVKVHYTGTLMNGKKFDSSHDHGDKPFDFTIGAGGVIKGWDQGVVGMKVGGKRKLVIPSDLGYGAAGHPPAIPGNAGLKFDIELLEIVGANVADAGKDASKPK